MSTESINGYRPLVHFSARYGWINDPNGLVYADGRYHLFYQHNPAALVHGPMHWGHAVSDDLVRWTELPIALAPDAAGECFSGSAVAAVEGETGAGIGRDDILLFYTAHQKTAAGGDFQQQALVLADRNLARFTRYPANPVIANPGLAAFRDPKVFWHEPTRRWIMVVTIGQAIGFYASPDALNWSPESQFGEGHGFHSAHPWECPDLFALPHPRTGAPVWVLVVGIGSDGSPEGSRTQYFLGSFDGRRFTSEAAPETILWLDEGPDYYATQSFAGPTPGRLAISWMSNWNYAARTPTDGFRGTMTLPRTLTLIETGDGLRLAQQVPADVAGQLPLLPLSDGAASPPGPVFRLQIDVVPQEDRPFVLTLFGGTPVAQFVRRSGRLEARLLRPAYAGIAAMALDKTIVLPDSQELDLSVFVDNGHVELLALGGSFSATVLHFPVAPAGGVSAG